MRLLKNGNPKKAISRATPNANKQTIAISENISFIILPRVAPIDFRKPVSLACFVDQGCGKIDKVECCSQ
jgi:hypothetical protein